MVSYANVNTNILRDGSSWVDSSQFVEDTTRSGKTKRRLANTGSKRQFTVRQIFTYNEYITFKSWYQNTCRKGFFSFAFPAIDIKGTRTLNEYRFVSGTAPEYSNILGDKIECKMTWEEVNTGVTL